MYVTQKKKTIIDTEREAAILQPHFFLRQLSSGSLKSEVFVVVVLPQPRKLRLIKNHQTGLSLIPCKFGLGNHRFHNFPKRNLFPETSAEFERKQKLQ